ncbi:MAG TPA: TspO/MBR family protein [Steroidobacteraceae bacterium]|nr:TspO/MBR family protein [Steroidobacteraceae bacterium]
MRIPVESSTSYRGRNSRPHWLILAAFVGSALAAGALNAVFSPVISPAARRWYAGLARPEWAPPDAWFGPVWMALYVLMGTAAWLIWRERYHRGRGAALAAYAVQLLLNAAWAPLFFGARNIGAGLFVIVALWLSIAATVRAFAAVKAFPAWLLAPYLIWVGYASALNFAVWKLNQ